MGRSHCQQCLSLRLHSIQPSQFLVSNNNTQLSQTPNSNDTEPLSANFCLIHTRHALRNPRCKSLRKLKSFSSQQPQLTVEMLSKFIVLAMVWSTLSGSIAHATPLAKRALSTVDESVPWYCRPSFQDVFSYGYLDISEGIFHLTKKTLHTPTDKEANPISQTAHVMATATMPA
jgi:hypothetical protein